MINATLLKSVMVLHGDGQKALAEKLGICQPSLSNKLKGATPWMDSEIKAVSDVYNLTPQQIYDIFLN